MRKLYVIIILSVITIIAFADILEKDGKAGRTGAPGENDCTGCHTSYLVNSGPGSITISSPNLINWQYVPGQTYQIDVTVSHTGVSLFGFGFEALRTTGANGGTLAITNSTQTHLKTANILGNNRTNVVHQQNGGATANSHTFSFNWTAPPTNQGNITFYTAGNAADNQNDSLHDYIYKTSHVVTPSTVGIAEAANQNLFSVFPNPAKDYLTIHWLEQNLTSCQLVLYNLNGQAVLEDKRENINPFQPVTLHLPEHLSNGIYLLKGLSGKHSFTKQILIYN